MSKPVTVYYDGGCPLCLREIRLMRRLDRGERIDFVDVDNPDTVCPLDRETLLARFHAREGDTMYSGAAAFAAMWRQIPWLRPLGLLARNRIILSVLEWTYLRFLVIRPRLQRLVS
ncbi:MAG: DUF393 domain-containing protein [Pseudomonadota bacterium]